VSISSRRNWVFISVAVIAIGIVVALILSYRRAAAEREEIAYIAADWEQRGLLPRADYIKLREIISEVRQRKTISDKDLDWSLALMARNYSVCL
jgi:hypothetical protein